MTHLNLIRKELNKSRSGIDLIKLNFENRKEEKEERNEIVILAEENRIVEEKKTYR